MDTSGCKGSVLTPPDDEQRRLSIRLTEAEHRRARLAAAAKGISLNEFGRRALMMKVRRRGVFDPGCSLVREHTNGSTCPECGGRGTPIDRSRSALLTLATFAAEPAIHALVFEHWCCLYGFCRLAEFARLFLI